MNALIEIVIKDNSRELERENIVMISSLLKDDKQELYVWNQLFQQQLNLFYKNLNRFFKQFQYVEQLSLKSKKVCDKSQQLLKDMAKENKQLLQEINSSSKKLKKRTQRELKAQKGDGEQLKYLLMKSVLEKKELLRSINSTSVRLQQKTQVLLRKIGGVSKVLRNNKEREEYGRNIFAIIRNWMQQSINDFAIKAQQSRIDIKGGERVSQSLAENVVERNYERKNIV